MAADLTVDNLCEAIRHFLVGLAGNLAVGKAAPGSELVLHGVPADAKMKLIMEHLGGTLRITVHELPAELKVSPVEAVADVNLWHPEEELDEHSSSRTEQPAGALGSPRGEDSGYHPRAASRGPQVADHRQGVL